VREDLARRIVWHDQARVEHERPVNDVLELERVLKELADKHAGKHAAVFALVLDNGDEISFGLGRSRTYLAFTAHDNQPPYWQSVSGAKGPDTSFLLGGGEPTVCEMRNAIPMRKAHAVLRQFWETGELSKDINWEET
jgi:hypothetical protein